jgi:isocitrate dehydrogenase
MLWREATIETIESGSMTKDLVLITKLENPRALSTEEFIKAVAERLAKKLEAER